MQLMKPKSQQLLGILFFFPLYSKIVCWQASFAVKQKTTSTSKLICLSVNECLFSRGRYQLPRSALIIRATGHAATVSRYVCIVDVVRKFNRIVENPFGVPGTATCTKRWLVRLLVKVCINFGFFGESSKQNVVHTCIAHKLFDVG